jgi:hypothetical protein
MGVDKSYGSGKSRSAANSRARQRAAVGNFTKGAKPTTRLLKKVAAENPVTGFISGGVSAVKLGKVASNLFNAGKVQDSMAVAMRAFTKTGGRAIGKGMATGKVPSFKALGREVPASKNLQLMKEVRGITSRRVFPKSPK